MRSALETGALLLLVAMAGCARRAPPAVQVVYYQIPGCGVCAQTRKALAALAARLDGRMRLVDVDCTSPEGVAAAARYGFASHGVVVLARDGTLVWKQKDHHVNPADVTVVVEAQLARR
jgi:hypothetical protein